MKNSQNTKIDSEQVEGTWETDIVMLQQSCGLTDYSDADRKYRCKYQKYIPRPVQAGLCVCFHIYIYIIFFNLSFFFYITVQKQKWSFLTPLVVYLLTVDHSDRKREWMCARLRVYILNLSIYVQAENDGAVCCYATLASQHSSLPCCQPHPHGFIRKYITLMTACPVSNTTNCGACVCLCVCVSILFL